jgi:hypothetical protein
MQGLPVAVERMGHHFENHDVVVLDVTAFGKCPMCGRAREGHRAAEALGERAAYDGEFLLGKSLTSLSERGSRISTTCILRGHRPTCNGVSWGLHRRDAMFPDVACFTGHDIEGGRLRLEREALPFSFIGAPKA